MGIYIAPQFQDNSNLNQGDVVSAEVLEIKVLSDQTWAGNKGIKVTEVIFKTDTGNIIVQKEKHSIGKTSMLNRLYHAIIGKNIDIKTGFHTNEILNQTVTATVNTYDGNGYKGATLIDFK